VLFLEDEYTTTFLKKRLIKTSKKGFDKKK